MKLALVGAGYWGKNLVRVFHQLGVLKVICDKNKKTLLQRKKEYPDLQTTTDFSEVLRKNMNVKGVIIATPAATHYKLTKQALLNGKDVFVEKPLALKVHEGEELVKIARRKKLILMVGHLLLYHPVILRLEEIIKKGDLGKIRYAWSNRLNFGKLRREENVLWSFAPHDISVIINILGTPDRVMAQGKTYLQKGIPDITLTFLEFKKGKAAHIFVSWLNPFKEQKLTIVGSKKMIVFDDRSKDKLVIYPHRVKWHSNQNLEALKAEGKSIKFSSEEPLMKEAKHFLECIKKREKPKTDGKEALNVLKVLDACQKSMNKDGRVVKF
jgi:UDP-2-acetamido-3-amino-2,3-dideoxy-glucuronate N-acetyltransferase